MKLNETNPQQHLMILVGAGACIFLNFITMFKARSNEPELLSNQPRLTESIDAVTGSISTRETKFTNPKLSWFESIFCRGMQRSSNCSYKLLHPFANDSDEFQTLPDAEPKSNHVVYYRGSISKNNALSRTIEAPAEEAPPVRIIEDSSSENN